MTNPIRTRVLLGLIVLLSLGLRLWGITWGLPNHDRFTTLYIDEYTPLMVLSQMNPSHGDFNPRYSDNPTFFYYQYGAALAIASKVGLITITKDKDYFLQHPEEYAQLYLVGRALCVVYGIATTLAFFFLGKRISGSERGGLWVSLFYAVIPVTVVNNHITDTGIPASFWLVLCLLGCLEHLATHQKRWLYFASIVAGFSLSTKYTSAPVVFPLLYTAWASTGRMKTVLLALAAAGLGFLAGTPYMLLDPVHMTFGPSRMWNCAVGANTKSSLISTLYPLSLYAQTVGVPLILLALTGLYMEMRSRAYTAILATLFLVPYFGLLAKSSLHCARYLNESLPFLLPFSAIPILRMQKARFTAAPWLATILALLCLSRVPYTFAINRSLSSEVDPRDQASTWITTHIPNGSRIGMEMGANFMLPAHLYMDYWRGIRYPNHAVLPPHYQYSIWEQADTYWKPKPPDYWVENNLTFRGITKSTELKEIHARDLQLMRQGYRSIKYFERDIRWGPFRYPMSPLAGHDWRIFLPEITIYERT